MGGVNDLKRDDVETRTERVASATRPSTLLSESPSFGKLLLALVPTANALLLIAQATLAEPPLSTLLPSWVYLVVNVAVVLGAATTRAVAVVVSNPFLSQFFGPDDEIDDTSEVIR